MIVLLYLVQYVICQQEMISTPVSLNNQTDKVDEVEINITDYDENLKSDDAGENVIDRIIFGVIIFLRNLFPNSMEANEIFNTTLSV
ncbi:unnamed protein product [Schistosoma rodhaini]|uniref:Uncharacterized protein n=1 Tax=Schistosoma rodhaini TaxID=6188 RepID=A0AA85ER72_9TREM|nr:unnamed protein product [Schistosoma rodhaini]CAH8682316.1 unnamed protein product [Schistosoma rodhaini]